jgi:phosphoadenosine phosphosulfate reductase
VRSLSPSLDERQKKDAEGTLWSRNADACCDFRKTIPLARALEPFQAQITGRKRFQTRERADMQAVEYFEGRYRFNPLWQWDLQQLEAFPERNNLPRHPLVEDGYPSIGCMPCTSRVADGEDARAGRWRGKSKVECGIHVTPEKSGSGI